MLQPRRMYSLAVYFNTTKWTQCNLYVCARTSYYNTYTIDPVSRLQNVHVSKSISLFFFCARADRQTEPITLPLAHARGVKLIWNCYGKSSAWEASIPSHRTAHFNTYTYVGRARLYMYICTYNTFWLILIPGMPWTTVTLASLPLSIPEPRPLSWLWESQNQTKYTLIQNMTNWSLCINAYTCTCMYHSCVTDHQFLFGWKLATG